MTISTQTFRFSYVSTGGTTYAYTNKILSENDLTVYVDDVLQTLSTHYTVSGVGEAAGGNVVFLVAPAAASVVLITKDGVEFTQETDYVENDAFPAESHENALDKLTNIAQKIWDYTRRSIKLPITSSLTDIELPTPEANKVIGWNAAADKLQNLALTGFGAISDEAYNSTTWDAVDEIAPSKNAVRDKLEAMISDTAYNSTTWNGVSTIAPSKNAVRDEFESMRATIPDFATAAEELAGASLVKASSPGIAIPEHFSNLSFTATVAAKALTVSLKGADGNAPSATNKPKIKFRSATITDSKPVTREITDALTVTLSSGSTLGFTTALPGRIYVWAIDNAGTVELALSRTADIFPESDLVSTTAEGGAGGADSAAVMYSTSARTNVACRCIGYIEITTGATAGEWDNAPTKIQVMGPGVKRTGDIVQTVYYTTGSVVTGNTAMPFDDTIPQITEGVECLSQAITPTSAVNNLEFIVTMSTLGTSWEDHLSVALFVAGTNDALAAWSSYINSAHQYRTISGTYKKLAGSTSSQTFSVRAGGHAAGTVITLNGYNTARKFGGVAASNLYITEVFA